MWYTFECHTRKICRSFLQSKSGNIFQTADAVDVNEHDTFHFVNTFSLAFTARLVQRGSHRVTLRHSISSSLRSNSRALATCNRKSSGKVEREKNSRISYSTLFSKVFYEVVKIAWPARVRRALVSRRLGNSLFFLFIFVPLNAREIESWKIWNILADIHNNVTWALGSCEHVHTAANRRWSMEKFVRWWRRSTIVSTRTMMRAHIKVMTRTMINSNMIYDVNGVGKEFSSFKYFPSFTPFFQVFSIHGNLKINTQIFSKEEDYYDEVKFSHLLKFNKFQMTNT